MGQPATLTLTHRVVILALLAAGVVLSVVAFRSVSTAESSKARALFERAALERIEAVQRQIDRNLEVVRSIVGLFDASSHVERDEFRAFVAQTLEREPGIQALEWIPRVTHAEREMVERQIAALGAGNREIVERGPDGALQRAAERAEYYPVFYVEPMRGNEPALGFDLASDPERRRTLEEARDSGQLTASAGISLVQGADKGVGLLVAAPVYRGGRPVSLQERRERLIGYALGVFRASDWVAEASLLVTVPYPVPTAFYLFDERESNARSLLARWASAASSRPPPVLSLKQLRSGPHISHTFVVAGRPWTLIARPQSGRYVAGAVWQAWGAAIAIILLTGMLIAYLRALLLRTAIVERQVAERTALAEARGLEIEQRDRMLEAIIEGSPDGILALSPAGVIERTNAAARRIFGGDSGYFHQRSFDGLLGESSDVGWFRQVMEEIRREGRGAPHKEHIELTGMHSDGTRFPMEVAIRVSELPDRLMPIAFVTDITLRRRLERELNQFFTLSLEMLGIIGFDGYFRRINPAWETTLGHTPEQLCSQPLVQFVHPEDREKTLEEMRRLAEGGHATASFENRLLRRDGSYRVLVWNAASSAEDGTVYVVARDVTDLRRQVQRIELQSAALRSAANAIVITDRDGRISWVNPSFTELTGYTLAEVEGKTPRILKSEKQDRRFYQDLWNTITRGEVWQGELINRRKDGSTYEEYQTITPVVDDTGAITHYVGVKEDITRRKDAERQLLKAQRTLEAANERLKEVDRLKSMFIASMSHELRTPLNSIIGFTGVILQGLAGDLNDTQRDQLQRVYKAAKHLLALISDVIDISKIEAEKVEAYPEEFDLVELVREAAAGVEQAARDKGLALQVECPAQLMANTDRRRVLQCALNLISNAVKYTQRGSVSLRLADCGEFAEIAVTDTGIGIAESDIKVLFQSFVRLDSELRISVPGTGLGLYLTRKIARMLLDGDVKVASRQGEGSTFVLRFRRDLAQANRERLKQETAHEDRADH
ncbi:MAG: hypothetical protein Kow006_04420 [Gammaproteobacteria bacterium]